MSVERFAVTKAQHGRLFGKSKQEHLLILASGDRIRHLSLKPWMMGLCVGAATLLGCVYLLATSYLVMRDDLIGAAMARQARMQFDYEDRISALRAQVDRITSRQLLDQQLVEDKVDKLLEQQEALGARAGKAKSLFGDTGSTTSKAPDSPAADHEDHAFLSGNQSQPLLPKPGNTVAEAPSRNGESAGDRSDRMFAHMTLSLKAVEEDQRFKLAHLAEASDKAADAISSVLRRFDLPVPPAETQGAVGGPFVDPVGNDDFGSSLAQLDNALNRFEAARKVVNALPFTNPALGKEVTSPFGNRRDPFLGRLALHSGIDFRFSPGEIVRPAAPGKVVAAGWTGGYGNMVEIDHGNGITTRYGHLSQVLVRVGDAVAKSDRIGLAGSTGRSTGTHLHYEVRQNGQPVDPIFFINAGLKLDKYIE